MIIEKYEFNLLDSLLANIPATQPFKPIQNKWECVVSNSEYENHYEIIKTPEIIHLPYLNVKLSNSINNIFIKSILGSSRGYCGFMLFDQIFYSRLFANYNNNICICSQKQFTGELYQILATLNFKKIFISNIFTDLHFGDVPILIFSYSEKTKNGLYSFDSWGKYRFLFYPESIKLTLFLSEYNY